MKIKLLILLIVIMVIQANAMSDNDVKSYMKKYVETKMQSQVKQIDIISTYPIKDAPGWRVYFLSIRVKVKLGDTYQEAIVPQTVFTKGDRITLKLMKKGRLRSDGTRRKGKSYADLLKPKVPIDAYDDAHFIAGSKNAPHKILMFTDPFCPYCRGKIKEVIDIVRKNPKIYGFYYYHFPLVRIHPASDVTTRAMHVFQKRGDIDNMLKLYHLPIETTETNVDKILKAIKDTTGVTITRAEIDSPETKEALRVDMAMKRRLQVTGTPTIFIDGSWDRLRKEYKKYAIHR
ncbi:MAG: thioredoxin domain-containing protein [Epsilonproteobacteria bacterium]|nr:thioredoxin domain-containing protein [Campylobacterota bacterium]